jgi:hypothetical protein
MRTEGAWAYKIMLGALQTIARNETNAGLEARAALRRIGEDWQGVALERDGK